MPILTSLDDTRTPSISGGLILEHMLLGVVRIEGLPHSKEQTLRVDHVVLGACGLLGARPEVYLRLFVPQEIKRIEDTTEQIQSSQDAI